MLHAERHLLDGVARILRNPAARQGGWALLALHLSRLSPSGPRPHHRRIAASVLDEAASRTAGQIFTLANGDMAMLFRPADGGEAVTAQLVRLFQSDVPETDALRSVWPLPAASAAALGYVQARVTQLDKALPPEPRANAGVFAAMDALVQTAPLAELMHRQTAVMLRPGKALRITPLFREVAISTAVLEAKLAAAGQTQADPFLFSHLAVRLDRRMLAALLTDVPGRGFLSGGLGGAALHVNLTLAGILSDGFAAFAAASHAMIAAGLRVAVELPFVEVFGDTKSFVLARERLRLARMLPVLDGVTHHSLLLTRPEVLDTHLLKLNWSPAMPDMGKELREAVQRIGPDRIVLHRVESEVAASWGLTNGIRRFQGRYVDSMLAAQRLAACAHSRRCTLRNCNDRAAATGTPGRAGCNDPALLDLGAPVPAAAGHAPPLAPPSDPPSVPGRVPALTG